MNISFENHRLDHLFSEVKEKIPLSESELLTPSTVYGVVPQSSLPFKPHQILRDDFSVHPAKPGDFVISMSSFQHGFEYCALNGGISSDYVLLRPKFDQEIGRFLKYSLKSEFLIQKLTMFRSGIRQGQRLQWNRVRYVKIPVPDSISAKVVADFLERETERIDLLIEKKLLFISTTEDYEDANTRSILSGETTKASSHAVTKVPWLGSVPSHWELFPLRHLVRITTGCRDTQDRVENGKYPFFVRSMNVERINTWSHDEEAVLAAGDGNVGKIFHYVQEKFDLHQRMYAFTKFRHISGKYFYHFLRAYFQLQMTQWSAKTTVESVRLPFLKSMIFAVPPLKEQEKLVSQINASHARSAKIISATERSIIQLRELRSALITAAVTGQIDLTSWGEQGKVSRQIEKIEGV